MDQRMEIRITRNTATEYRYFFDDYKNGAPTVTLADVLHLLLWT